MKFVPYFQDGMVLQRDMENQIFGTEVAGQEVWLEIAGERYEGTTDMFGRFTLTLKSMAGGGPYEMRLTGTQSIILKDIYIGDVFLLTGQSNMQLPLKRVMDIYEEEVMADVECELREGLAERSEEWAVEGSDIGRTVIRHYTAEQCYSFEEEETRMPSGRWESLSQDSLMRISAVGYFFAKRYQDNSGDVHIGLINCAIGGSPIEAWCSADLLRQHKRNSLAEVHWFQKSSWLKAKMDHEADEANQWRQYVDDEDICSHAYEEGDIGWKEWDRLTLPLSFSDLSDLAGMCGALWMKREVILSKKDMAVIEAGETLLRFGTMTDRDDIWINGTHIGSTAYQYPPRKYSVPENVLHEGSNTVTVRLVVEKGNGEITRGKPYCLISRKQSLDKQWRINLRGEWRYKVGVRTDKSPDATFLMCKPTALYNTMIYPLRHTAVKGLLWYQGESNVSGDSRQNYEVLFDGMVESIRTLFGQEKLPVVSVLLAGLGSSALDGPAGETATFRLLQLKGASLDHVSVITAADLGEWNDIHPLRKKTVGERMAEAMTHLMDGKGGYHGPVIRRVECNEDGWVLYFDNVLGGLMLRSETYMPIECTYGGSDKYQWTLAKVIEGEGNSVKVHRPADAVTVKSLYYGMEDFPRVSGIYDGARRPAMPFVWDFK